MSTAVKTSRKTSKQLQVAMPGSNLDAYLSWVYRIPVLTLAEEQELTRRYYENNDIEAARSLVTAHLRFVVKIARNYMGYGLALGDLIQEGSIGLMKAIKRFDPNVGVRLVSFGVHWIKAEIHEFVLRNWRIVKVATTKAQRKLFFNLRSAKKHLSLSCSEAEMIAENLGVSTKDVWEMDKRLQANDATFEAHPSSDSEDSRRNFSPSQYLEDHKADPAYLLEHQNSTTHHHDQLQHAMTHLDERSKDILQARWLNDKKATLQELADKYGVSAERIRQIESNFLKKLKSLITQS